MSLYYVRSVEMMGGQQIIQQTLQEGGSVWSHEESRWHTHLPKQKPEPPALEWCGNERCPRGVLQEESLGQNHASQQVVGSPGLRGFKAD